MTHSNERRKVEVLLDRVSDKALREQLAAEIASLTDDRRFGLVFEKHLPEAIRIPGAPIRYGSTVAYRDGDDHRIWQVKRVRKGHANIVHDDEKRDDVPFEELIVTRKLGDPVYPGLTPLGVIDRGGPERPHHLVIEGENYHALQTLQYTHRRAVDLIYIDPPYNTGNKSWKYNDRYVADTDAYRHSKWLSFMERRLELARTLLTDTGVIIVAIDDNEHHRLRMLMDQVFGARNFIANVVWTGGRQNDTRHVSISHDYMLVYARDKEIQSEVSDRWREPKEGVSTALRLAKEAMAEEPNDISAATSIFRKRMREENLPASIRRFNKLQSKTGRPHRDDRDLSAPDKPETRSHRPLIHPVTGKPCAVPSRGWAVSDQTMDQLLADGLIVFGADETRVPTRYGFLDEQDSQAPDAVFNRDRNVATRRLTEILGSKDFPFPKDVDVIARWVNITTAGKKDAVVLDFFAGTGTTAEAVMRLNAEDGGTRQSIIVTNNELAAKDDARLRKEGFEPGDDEYEALGVFHHVTRPRIETVVTGVRRDGSTYSDGLDENVTFAKLTYLDRDDVELGAAFKQVAELLWAQAGARGEVITKVTPPFALTDHYGVLFDVGAWSDFAAAVEEKPRLRTAYIVTGSPTSYATARRALPEGVEGVHLYENYLASFEINTKEGV